MKNVKVYPIMLSGLFAGLAFVTHLNALVFPVVGFFFLLFNKKWNLLIYYTLVCSGVCLLYTHELWNQTNLETFLYQLKHWPTHQETFGEKVDGGILMAIWNNILRVLNEHKRYFWDQDVWGISALFLVTLISQFKHLWNNYKSLTIYTLLLMFFLAVLSSSHGARYLVYLMPFMSVIIGLGVFRVIQTPELKIIKWVYLLIFLVQMVFVGMTYGSIFEKNYNHVKEHHRYLSKVEKGSRVLGPWEFVYNEIDEYEIFSFKTYEYIEDREHIELTQRQLLEKAALDFEMDYIILNKERKNSKEFPWFKNWNIVPNPYFEEVFRDENYLILKRQSSSV
ncbi:hypothetical protein JL102_12090 [Fulvivirga sp. 2943]|uniref:Uncharacterized protein n=1 Tax=Fulvivirga sediminis TaxID=2803949 RepID=A0A937K1N6_9BACT|nr:hypothetical protein [Fulvivirga sediminis]